MDREKNRKDLSRILDVIDCEAKQLYRISEKLKPGQVAKVMEILENTRGKIITSGCGTSGAAAKKVAHTFCCIEMPAFFLSPSEALHGGMGAVQKEDTMVFFSKGGHTEELKAMGRAACEKGASVITVTEAADGFLTRYSDAVLQIQIDREPDTFNMLATASTLGVIAVFDALAITISEKRGYTKEEFLLIHPGGEVGERLLQQTRST